MILWFQALFYHMQLYTSYCCASDKNQDVVCLHLN